MTRRKMVAPLSLNRRNILVSQAYLPLKGEPRGSDGAKIVLGKSILVLYPTKAYFLKCIIVLDDDKDSMGHLVK